ncbi:hypothetical protein LTR48_001440 [Friedmanniomyces endolithicus]|uniref:Uncharacterized protein n=1 Tax=Rachicladosporium monterosium TaxID=1507873 RepID=A0ABR0L4N2_9PEZI|nr:hypothetical protein LTR48_001440 [Friedmanniomyces endolithicus]KAK5143468.1 hypothetical protein LTR32_004412 [Rachicladosporium monterosium]
MTARTSKLFIWSSTISPMPAKRSKSEHDTAVRDAENLRKAVLAAEEQVKRLEYWSNVKGMADEDALVHDERLPKDSAVSNGGHPVSAFANKQNQSEKAAELHGHAEHHTTTPDASKVGRAAVLRRFDAPTSPPDGKKLEGQCKSALRSCVPCITR